MGITFRIPIVRPRTTRHRSLFPAPSAVCSVPSRATLFCEICSAIKMLSASRRWPYRGSRSEISSRTEKPPGRKIISDNVFVKIGIPRLLCSRCRKVIFVHADRTETKLVNEGLHSIIEMFIHRSTNIWSIRSLIVTSRHRIPKLDDKKSSRAGTEKKPNYDFIDSP